MSDIIELNWVVFNPVFFRVTVCVDSKMTFYMLKDQGNFDFSVHDPFNININLTALTLSDENKKHL